MTLTPKAPRDLLLAPVAAEIDANLAGIRDALPAAVADAVAMALNVIVAGSGPAQRAAWIHELALRDVDLHHWHTEITADHARLRISGGSVTLELGLGKAVTAFIDHGA